MRTVLGIALIVGVAQCATAQTLSDARRAAERALPILQRSAGTFVEHRSCVSCHHNALPIFVLQLAQDRGLGVDRAVLHAVEQKTFRELGVPTAFDDAVQGNRVSDPTPNDSLLLMAAYAAGLPASLTTSVYANRLRLWQRDGYWVTSDFRPPHSSSRFTATATAIRATLAYLPVELKRDGAEAVARARTWLTAAAPQSTEDASFRVFGLAWARAGAEDLERASRDLFARQLPNGGWPQLPGYASDAYSTGEALVALREAGTATSDARWRHGLRFLLSTQARDGTWRVRTRMLSPATVSPPYFETGFPYGKDQFLSYAGSCWAVMALLTDLPSTTAAGNISAVPGSNSAFERFAPTEKHASNDVAPDAAPPAWARLALFGTAAQLRQLLDDGLDPNAQTSGGTTVLMMAATDPQKVSLLLARGADVRARSKSGADALAIAASYAGTSSAVDLLLAAGADAQPPQERSVKRGPLLFASTVGDIENVTRLLAHGADPDGGPTAVETPVSSAVTFGHADVVRLLVGAGAKVHVTARGGINLLHWATIANRAEVIPILAGAGVSINDVDDNGYTPLMYAATIDFGDTATLRALLQSGADPKIENDEHRTAAQQARHFRHKQHETALH